MHATVYIMLMRMPEIVVGLGDYYRHTESPMLERPEIAPAPEAVMGLVVFA
jgi:hypothetical protein